MPSWKNHRKNHLLQIIVKFLLVLLLFSPITRSLDITTLSLYVSSQHCQPDSGFLCGAIQNFWILSTWLRSPGATRELYPALHSAQPHHFANFWCCGPMSGLWGWEMWQNNSPLDAAGSVWSMGVAKSQTQLSYFTFSCSLYPPGRDFNLTQSRWEETGKRPSLCLLLLLLPQIYFSARWLKVVSVPLFSLPSLETFPEWCFLSFKWGH